MHDILAVLITAMLVGYIAMEVGRFRRAKVVGMEPAWYRWLRVTVRVAMGSVVTGMAWVWATWEELSPRLPDATTLVFFSLASLIGLLLIDLTGLSIQVRRERKRREADFLMDMERLVQARPKDKGSADPSS